LDSGADNRSLSRNTRKKFLAFAMIGIMIVSAIAMIAPSINWGDGSDEPIPAGIEYGGQRETKITFTNFFEIYEKSTEYSDLGRTNGTMGISEWFIYREPNYGEYIVRDEYPYVLALDACYEAADVDPGFYAWAPFRVYVEANNITGHAGPSATADIGTGPDKDPYFLPIISGNPSLDGGWVNISFYGTYMTDKDLSEIRNRDITHYANSYFDVGFRDFPSLSNDGYWHELMAEMDLDRQASVKFLGLPGTGDLRDEFNTSQLTDDIDYYWNDEWSTEGAGIFDIYTGYEYSQDIRFLHVSLDDLNSTADKLVLRMYCVSWGMDAQLMRFLEAGNITPAMQGYVEDQYLNLTIGPDMADAEMRMTMLYQLKPWKDEDVFMSAWRWEPEHLDYLSTNKQHDGYDSPYDDYSPVKTDLLRPWWHPGTTTYGQDTSYWVGLGLLNLSDGETLTINLPSTDVIAYDLYVGATNVINDAKVIELNSNTYWGEMVLGTGNPDVTSMYDPATKTLTIEGPFNAWDNARKRIDIPSLVYEGCPGLNFAVSPVSDYDVDITEVGPYDVGITYTVQVTAKNLSDVTVTDWNGTVQLSCSDPLATFPGGSSHTFVPADNGVWTTTVEFGTPSIQAWINASDSWYPLDVNGSLEVTIIPEFSFILIPVIGAVALFLVLRTRKRRE